MRTEKDALPKGYSYPLKPSVLAAALADAGIEIDTHLIRGGFLFEAYFWPRNRNVPYERLYIRTGSVPSYQNHDARRWVENVMIPDLTKWIAGILMLDQNSPIRREKQYVCFPRGGILSTSA